MENRTEDEQETGRKIPSCPLCGWRRFYKHEGRIDSKWGITSHQMTLLICENCKFVLHFYEGHSYWDFD